MISAPPPSPEFLAHCAERRARLRAHLAEVLQRPQALILEIGCGHGHFLTRYAQEHPEDVCVGIDLLAERLERAEKKRRRSGLETLRFVKAEAREFLEALPEERRCSAVFLLFPDPWPKRRHHKHRLLQPSFLDLLAKRAAPGCRFYFRTDHEEYFSAAEATVEAHPAWRRLPEPEALWPLEETTVFQAKAKRHRSLVAEVVDSAHLQKTASQATSATSVATASAKSP